MKESETLLQVISLGSRERLNQSVQFGSFPFETRSNHLWPFVYGRPPVSSKLDYVDTKTSISNSSICRADAAWVTESITNGKI